MAPTSPIAMMRDIHALRIKIHALRIREIHAEDECSEDACFREVQTRLVFSEGTRAR